MRWAGRLALDTLDRSERNCGYFDPRTVKVRHLITNMRGFVDTIRSARHMRIFLGMTFLRLPATALR